MLRMAARPPSSGVARAGRIQRDPSIPHPAFVAGLTLVTALWGAPRALAQQVVGRVAAEGSGDAIVGAFVRLVPEDGGRATAALTGGDGRYLITVAAPGRYRIHIEFLGYAPYESEPVTLERGQTIAHDVSLAIRPIELPEIAARVENRCDAAGAGRPLEYSLWDAARTALRVAAWATETRKVDYRIARTSRQLDRRTLEPTISYRADWLWRRMGAPWEFAPPDRLLREGFAIRYTDGTVQLLVPGPDIFLEDAFLASHCFHVTTADPPAPGLIGLAFEPVGDDDTARIAGVLWLDRDRLVLHSLDFRYIIPWRSSPIPSARGSLRFAYLPSGLWIIRDWTLRMPVRLRSQRRGNGDLVVEDGAHVVFALDEAGEVIWADSALAAEMGRDDEPDGTTTSPEPTSSIFTIESPAALAAQGCGVHRKRDDTVDAVGFVGDVDGNPLPNARVVVRWSDGRRVRETEVRTTLAGLFTVCAIPTDTEIEIEATRFGFAPWLERGRTRDGRLFTAELLLRPAP